MRRQPDQSSGSVHLAALFVEIAGEDGLGDFFGYAEIEAVDASAGCEVNRSKLLAAGVNLDDSLSAADVEEFFDQAQRFEDLQRAWMDYSRSVPVVRAGAGINQMARDVAALKFGGEE